MVKKVKVQENKNKIKAVFDSERSITEESSEAKELYDKNGDQDNEINKQ